MNGRALVVRGDALRLPLPDESVDLIVTSPPYWALRDYQTPGQLGSEPTPHEFLENLWAATREMVRVLKPTGSIFIDLGDKYSERTGGKHHSSDGYVGRGEQAGIAQQTRGPGEKSLMLLPERYRIGCVDQLGLIARAVIVWDKPNGLPESVRDRVRRSHEDWVHLVRQPRYYSAIDEVREPHARNWRGEKGLLGMNSWATEAGRNDANRPAPPEPHPLGKLPGSVWSIPSEPLRLPGWLGVDHYAAFPSEWPRRFILGWSPPGICCECGMGRFPVVDRRYRSQAEGYDSTGRWGLKGQPQDTPLPTRLGDGTEATILGYACACTPHTDHPERRGKDFYAGTDRAARGMNDGNGGERFRRYQDELANPRGPVREYHLERWTPPPTRPALVLDPFGGTGTTAMVARALGRYAITVDLSYDYCRAARWRVFQSGNAGKALSRTWRDRQGTLT